MHTRPMTAHPQAIRFEFTVTADDIVDATRAFAQHRSKSGTVIGALLVGAGVVGWLVTKDWFWLALLPIGAIGVGSGLLRSIDRAFARAQPQSRIGTSCAMELTDAGLHFQQGGVDGLIDWTAVTELREGERSFLLLQDRTILASIPKRAFESHEELEAARAFLASRIPTVRQAGTDA
jgi:YcxB-like protein